MNSLYLKPYIENQKKLTNKELRASLMKQHPFCYWCGIKVEDSTEWHNAFQGPGRAPDNMATIEHLYDRFEINKRYRYSDNRYKVLACYKCNHERGNNKVKQLPKSFHKKRTQLLQKRDKTIPRPIYLLQNL